MTPSETWLLRQHTMPFVTYPPNQGMPWPAVRVLRGAMISDESNVWILKRYFMIDSYWFLLSWYHDASKKVNMMCESRSCLFLCLEQMCQSPRCSLGHQALQSHHLGLGNSGHPFWTAFKVKTKNKNQTCSMSIWTHIFSGGIHGLWDFFFCCGKASKRLSWLCPLRHDRHLS